MKITEIKVAECKLPLPKPIRLGPVEVRTRDFVVVRIVTESGLVGDALGYPRGTALFESVKRMAGWVLGKDTVNRRSITHDFLQNFVNGVPTYVKAASLVDIALWDIAGKEVRQPVFRMLGAIRSEVPVMVVAGYYLDQRTVEDVEREVASLTEQGFDRIKVMVRGNDLEFDERFVRAMHAIAGHRLCIDAHWSWNSVTEAYQLCRRLDDLNLRFIEDPFGPYRARQSAELQSMLRTPLACGEDAPDAVALFDLARTTKILRVDATTCGGLTPAIAVAEASGLIGHAVLPHVFLPVHAQMAGAISSIEAIELIPRDVGACPMFDLLQRAPDIQNGVLRIDEEPGAGFDLNWKHVEAFAVQTEHFR
jgi:L-alanine-DL-glutamate epimerase-like enolase superfamily enzyme